MTVATLPETAKTMFAVANLANDLSLSVIAGAPISYSELPKRYLNPNETAEAHILKDLKFAKRFRYFGPRIGVGVLAELQKADKLLQQMHEFGEKGWSDSMQVWARDLSEFLDYDDSFTPQTRLNRKPGLYESLRMLSLPLNSFIFLSWLDNVVNYYPKNCFDHKQIMNLAENVRTGFLKWIQPVFQNLEDFFTTLLNEHIRDWGSSIAATVESKPNILELMSLDPRYLKRFFAQIRELGNTLNNSEVHQTA